MPDPLALLSDKHTSSGVVQLHRHQYQKLFSSLQPMEQRASRAGQADSRHPRALIEPILEIVCASSMLA